MAKSRPLAAIKFSRKCCIACPLPLNFKDFFHGILPHSFLIIKKQGSRRMNLKKLFVLVAAVAAISTISGCASPKLFPWEDGFATPPVALGAIEGNDMRLKVGQGGLGTGAGTLDTGTGTGPFVGADGVLDGGSGEFDVTKGAIRWTEGIVYFGFDQSSIAETEYPKVNALVEHLKATPKQRVLIEGHCDSRGSDEYNRGLGERRANSIRDYMITAGITADRIQTISWGEEKPAVADAKTEEEYSQNRRGEFILSKPL
jgi:peptidoglycan-associated lipoprotein